MQVHQKQNKKGNINKEDPGKKRKQEVSPKYEENWNNNAPRK